MPVREIVAGTMLLLVAAAPAHASSFVSFGADPLPASRSVVLLGEPAARPVEATPVAAFVSREVFSLGPSVLAFGVKALPIEPEAVASIGERRGHRQAMPLVFRGGLTAETPSTRQMAQPAAPRPSAPAQGGTSAATPPPAATPRPAPEPSAAPFQPFSPLR